MGRLKLRQLKRATRRFIKPKELKRMSSSKDRQPKRPTDTTAETQSTLKAVKRSPREESAI